ncbi:MAG TPA: hypothetical protein VIJ33_08920 [Solirubrobacteraceae bacterium]
MSNFLDDLERQLVETARARNAAGRTRSTWWQRRRSGGDPQPPRRPGRRLRGDSRLLAALAAVLIAGGTAIAAVSISGEPSQPLSAVIPPGQQPHTALIPGDRYVVGLAPSIQAGQIAWCVSTRTFARSGRPEDFGTGGCSTTAATTGAPLLGRGTDNIVNGGGLSYVFATSRVAAIRIAGGPTVLTRPSAQLPYGYRVAVFEYTAPAGLLGLIRIPGGGSRLVTPLSASGQPIETDSSGSPVETTRSWFYPRPPATGSCSLSAKPGSPLRTGSGSVITAPVAAPTIAGAAFLPCITTDLYLPRGPASADGPAGVATELESAILLNAAHPGAPPADLPDMHAVQGTHGIYDRSNANVFVGITNPGLTAERIGNAWLVVAGGISTAQRIAALNDLTPGPINLAPPTSPPPPTPGGLCQIGYHPLAGMRETAQEAITTTGRIPPHVIADQDRGQHLLRAALNKLRYDEAHTPSDTTQIAQDQATISLLRQANLQILPEGGDLFAPTCATASFYYQQRWPMTATLILATKNCPGPRVFVPCNKLRPAARLTIANVLKRVPGHPNEFTVPPTAFFHPAETVEQINRWWIVIDGGKNPQQQQLLLNQLATAVSPQLAATLRTAIATPLTFCARQNPTAC